MLYTGQRALVAGASGGIGQAIAEDLIRNGCDVALTFRRSGESLEELSRLAASEGRACSLHALDVRDPRQVAEVCEAVASVLGPPTLLVCSAGIVRDRPLVQMEPQDWMDVIETNLYGTFHLARQVAPVMMRAGGGRILNIASVSGIHGQAGQANYAASKGGVISMTRALARELGPFNITVNALAPGVVETEMTAELSATVRRQFLQRIPLRRFAEPRDLVPAARLLLSPEGAYITGQVLVVDGGLTS
ncbi:MAG TPA: 3-oxoacyl-ACP reductase FabG [Thermoanaerobaculia bacterium]|jgi:3-oxoacyl-[acyl-carrier protein] reductase